MQINGTRTAYGISAQTIILKIFIFETHTSFCKRIIKKNKQNKVNLRRYNVSAIVYLAVISYPFFIPIFQIDG